MNRKIYISLGIVAFVAALTIGVTGAFFTDSETSTGNTFTAGSIDLKVDSTAHYDGLVCTANKGEVPVGGYHWALETAQGTTTRPELLGQPCSGSWTLTDLGPTNQFFNYTDVKPGDQGENTVSLHIDNNPAYACLNITTTSNLENTLTQPEINAGDVSSSTGELAGNLHFQAWLDQGATPGFQNSTSTLTDPTEGDNIWQLGEPSLAMGVMSDLVGGGLNLTLADGGTGTPIPPSSTEYVGLFWCAGTVTGGAGNLGCDGSTMGNQSQTDSVTANVTFMVTQARNNSAFRCVPATTTPQTATVKLDKVVTFTNAAIAGVDVSDYTLHLVGPGGDHVLVDEVAFQGLNPVVYTVPEVY